jgi:hypothetical protein
MMTDRLDEIRARADAATPGPWETGSDGRYGRRVAVDPPGGEYREIAECSGYVQPTEDTVVNAEFIAASREDVPYLLDRLEASEQEAARLRAALTWGVEWIEAWPGECMPEWREWSERGREALGATTATEAERAGPIPEGQI